ncbi:MAG: PucR family transcriptional regulator, partial [Jatrophihabitantaceae bacterium]
MDYSDPSKELAALLDRLPAVQAIGIAGPELGDPSLTNSERDLGTAGLAAGEIVLGIGVGAELAPAVLAAAEQAGVAAVILRAPVDRNQFRLAAKLGVELHELPRTVSWHALHQHLLGRLNPAVVHAGDELADLAQTIATLTGGPVTIEDSTSARVLAYSRSSDEIDELRRLSILGRSGPPEYLALLREWGVYDRLARSEEVVEIAEHQASGIRRRLAVGVFASDRQLATIWVQQGSSDLGPHAKQALLGAARLTAQLLVRSDRPRPAGRAEPGELASILAGRPGGHRLGRAAARACAVAVIEPGPTGEDPAASRRQLEELTTVVTVHAAAFRRNALVEQLAGRVYLLLPSLSSTGQAIAMLSDLIAAARRHLDPQARVVLGTLVGSIAEAPRSSRAAEAAL